MNPLALLALPAIPAFMALFLAIVGYRFSYAVVGGLATLAAGLALALALSFIPMDILGVGAPIDLDLGPWLATQGFGAGLRLHLDSVGLCMVLLVTFFGFLITAYSVGYMRDDREPARYFASINLFLASMLFLVLADNLVLIFLGWEGVGFCSYLLIGHYWEKPGVPLAAFRAFFVNRIGDLFFLLGVFTIYSAFGTVSFSELKLHGVELLQGHEGPAVLGALLLLGGALAKSAQAPLHVWLADAMAGPTPVSALIHAATMVTAGVYLMMRLDWLYHLVPQARGILALCALVTLVVGAVMALTQTDIKKILAYSTLSNLALMFLALAADSSHAAMLHLFGHAFFKALLFLAAGSVILSAHHEQDIRKLRGVLKSLPVTRLAFWVGCLGGAGLIPYFSAGFFTKEAVLESISLSQIEIFGWPISGKLLYAVVLAIESLSVLYLFRLLGYLSSDSKEKSIKMDKHSQDTHAVQETSLVVRFVLGVLILAAPGFALFSGTETLSLWISAGLQGSEPMHWMALAPTLGLQILAAAACFMVFSNTRRRESVLASLARFSLGGKGPLDRKFYFDDIYTAILEFPLKSLAWMTRLFLENMFLGALRISGWMAQGLSLGLRQLQTGQTQHYLAGILGFTALIAYFFLRS